MTSGRYTPDEKTWQKIIKYCTYQERCTSEVKNKLKALKVPEISTNDILEALSIEGYLNDERFTRSYVRSKFRYQQWGLKKIKVYLKQKGIDETLIERACNEEIAPDEYKKTASELVKRKLKSIAKEDEPTVTDRQKVWRFMLQRGFEPDVINSVLSN